MLEKEDEKTKKDKYMKSYEIWIGYYHLGQGDVPPTKPELLSTVRATSFKIACLLYEHKSTIQSLKESMYNGDKNIEDMHFSGWDYNPKTNSNSWTGKYYESKEEALKSFN